MRSRNNQNKSKDRLLSWMVGLIFAAIVFAGLVVAGILFGWRLPNALPFLPAPETGTPLSVVPTSMSQLPVTLPAEPSAVVTSDPSLPVVNFDPAAASQVSPADVLEEVTVFMGAGGPGEDGCLEGPAAAEPMFGTSQQDAEWLSEVSLTSCGWPPGESMVLTVSHDGAIYATENLQSSLSGFTSYYLPISSAMPDGDYTVAIESPHGRIETTVHVFVPSSPRMYPVAGEGLVLYSFAPKESVRLFAYQILPGGRKMHIAAWGTYQVDSSGRLIIQTDPRRYIYYVIGDRSGLHAAWVQTSSGLARPILVSPCAGGRPSYLEQGPDNASVESQTDLRSAPGESNASVAYLAAGTLVSVVDGPTCVLDAPWWYVQTGDGQSGWMPEVRADAYLLSPYPKDTLAEVAAGSADLEFDLATANQIPPQEVFDQVLFFAKGAGFCDTPPYSTPTITGEPPDAELFTESMLISCGWEQGEVLKGTIQYPDGHTLIRYIQAVGSNDLVRGELGFTPTLSDPPGTYTFTLQGQRGTLSATAEFRSPDGPRIYVLDDSHILLYHFAPGESVRLLCYGGDSHFRAWEQLTIDPSGNQPVNVETYDCAFVALGESSGEVHQVRDVPGTVQKTCGGLMSRLKDLSRVRIAAIDGTAKPLRTQPGNSQEVKASLPEGTNLLVSGLPHCVDGSLWWSVMRDDRLSGWLPEAQNGVFVLEPLP